MFVELGYYMQSLITSILDDLDIFNHVRWNFSLTEHSSAWDVENLLKWSRLALNRKTYEQQSEPTRIPFFLLGYKVNKASTPLT